MSLCGEEEKKQLKIINKIIKKIDKENDQQTSLSVNWKSNEMCLYLYGQKRNFFKLKSVGKCRFVLD